MLCLTQYEKSFGPEPVLQIPKLDLPFGVYHIAGANGAGKTTLLQSVAGLIPFKGSITVSGLNIQRNRIEYRKAVGYAEAEPLYPPFLTGNDLLHFYVQTKGGSMQQVLDLAATLGVGKFMYHRIETYSSGMVKKLSLLLAFVGNPKLILLDEPLITLDPDSVNTMAQLIASYYNRGVGFLITSHQALPLAVPCSNILVKDKTLHF